MTHSGERFSRCAHCGHKIRQRQTMGVWKHWATGLRECLAFTRAEPVTPSLSASHDTDRSPE